MLRTSRRRTAWPRGDRVSHGFVITIADAIFAIPTHCPENNFAHKMPLFEITSHLSASLWDRPAYRLHHRISTIVSCNSTPWINVLRRCDGDAIQRQQAPSNKADVEGDHRCRSRLNMRLCESGAYDGHFPKTASDCAWRVPPPFIARFRYNGILLEDSNVAPLLSSGTVSSGWLLVRHLYMPEQKRIHGLRNNQSDDRGASRKLFNA